MPAIGQIQRRGWCPKTITTSVGLADNAAGGQIHLPTVSNTINSESPTSTISQRQAVGRCHERRRPAAYCGAQMQNLSQEINVIRSANCL
jgi:hypothetical protein